MAKILFSPIGGSDPIRNYRDGSMLHICRNYLPDKVVLYLSGEMYQHHMQDDRYLYCLRQLEKQTGHKFEVELIVRKELKEVQDYEYFYDDFRQCIQDITKSMDKTDELLLNVSSGTPAMKNALVILSTLAEFPFKPVQVSTPIKRSNYMDENMAPYEVEEQWECDEDNQEKNAESRCEEIESMNLMRLLKINILKKHIQAFDYPAAYEVAKDIEHDLSPQVMLMLEQANARIQLDTRRVNEIAKKMEYQPMPIRRQEDCNLLEFVLLLQVKVLRKEYADFIRAITPAVFELFVRVLKQHCDVDIMNYCVERNNKLVWDKDKMAGTEVEEALEEEYKNRGGFKGGAVYSSHLKPVITYLCDNDKLCKLVENLRYAEENARNKAAHTIVSITNERIKSWTKFTAEELMDQLRKLTMMVGLDITAEVWKSYENMNESIIAAL